MSSISFLNLIFCYIMDELFVRIYLYSDDHLEILCDGIECWRENPLRQLLDLVVENADEGGRKGF